MLRLPITRSAFCAGSPTVEAGAATVSPVGDVGISVDVPVPVSRRSTVAGLSTSAEHMVDVRTGAPTVEAAGLSTPVVSTDAAAEIVAGLPTIEASGLATSAEHEVDVRAGAPAVDASVDTTDAEASAEVTAGAPGVDAYCNRRPGRRNRRQRRGPSRSSCRRDRGSGNKR